MLILHLSKSKYRSYNFKQREDKEANIYNDATVGERSNFKKFPTYTQDHGDGIATRGESVVHVPS